MAKKNREFLIGSPEHSRLLARERREAMAAAERRRDTIQGAFEHHSLMGPQPLDPLHKEKQMARANKVTRLVQEGYTARQISQMTPQDRNPYRESYRPLSVREAIVDNVDALKLRDGLA